MFELHPIFNRHGFYWGAAFGTRDMTHFEASDELVKQWSRDKLFGATTKNLQGALTIGDRGPDIEMLQFALNVALAPLTLAVDGIFGKDTRAAVVEYQRRYRFKPDGTCSTRLLVSLGLK